MTEQPHALRLADALMEAVVLDKHMMQAATELRRLHAQVDELERALGIAGKALRLSIECHRCGRYIANV